MTEQLAGQALEAAVPFVMELYAQKARLQFMGEPELLSSGMTGVIRVMFAFSEDWDGLKKTAVFSNGAVSIDVPEEKWEDGGCLVPQQVLAAAGKTLMVGLFGTDGDGLALPTVWCSLGRIEPGAALSGTAAMPPEAPVWARLTRRIGQLEGATPLLVRTASVTEIAAKTWKLTLDRSFSQIEAACLMGQLVELEYSGTALFLTNLIVGTSAEFTSTPFTRDGGACYHRCLVTPTGEATLTTLPVGASVFRVHITHAPVGYAADKTNAEIYAAAESGKMVIGYDPLDRMMQLHRYSSTMAWFTAIGYDHDEEEFAVQLYRLEGDTVTMDYGSIPNQAQLVQRVISALPVYGGEAQ